MSIKTTARKSRYKVTVFSQYGAPRTRLYYFNGQWARHVADSIFVTTDASKVLLYSPDGHLMQVRQRRQIKKGTSSNVNP